MQFLVPCAPGSRPPSGPISQLQSNINETDSIHPSDYLPFFNNSSWSQMRDSDTAVFVSLCPNCCYPLNSLSFSASVSITTSLRTCWSPACRAAWSWCVLSAHLRYCSIVQVTNSHLGPGSPQHLSQKRKLHLRCVENAVKCPVQTLMTEFNLYFYNLLHSYKMLQGQTAAYMRT